MSNPSYVQRVRAGAAWLDREFVQRPDQWWNRVDLAKLDMMDEQLCIAGQIFGDFAIADNKCSEQGLESCALGFDLYHEDFSDGTSKDSWKWLGRRWTQEILRRRGNT